MGQTARIVLASVWFGLLVAAPAITASTPQPCYAGGGSSIVPGGNVWYANGSQANSDNCLDQWINENKDYLIKCDNTGGGSSLFQVIDAVSGENYAVYVLEEVVAISGNLHSLNIRIGWNNQLPESRSAQTILVESDTDPETFAFGDAEWTNEVGLTGACGGVVYDTFATPWSKESRVVSLAFSGALVEVTNERGEITGWSVHAAVRKTWTLVVDLIQSSSTNEIEFGGSFSHQWSEGTSVSVTTTKKIFQQQYTFPSGANPTTMIQTLLEMFDGPH